MIDLRSDTASRPTAEMRAAMAAAEVGDEQLREDPTVNELQRRAAELLGHEAALFLPTATMANQIALRVLTRPGALLVAEERTHVMIFEAGGPAVHSGLVMRGLPGTAGRIAPEQLQGIDDLVPGSIVVLENTHRSAGGRVWPLGEIAAMAETCRELELNLHIDGARLFNAAVASGETPAAIAGHGDTVTICFSKGLGCPLGAVVAGSTERMLRARRFKHQFGGAMRQAGIVAAACVYALDHHVERLADDHARARRLAEGLHEAGVPIDLEQVETNFVQVDVGALGLEIEDAIERIRVAGIRVSGTARPGRVRAVTHLGIGDEDIEHAIGAIPRGLGVQPRSPAMKNAPATQA